MERFAPQLVNPNEELLDIPEDDRRLRAPAVRIRMMKNLLAEQHAALAEQIDDVDVGVEDVFFNQIWQTDFVGETPVIIDRRQDRQPFFSAQQVIVFTMARRDVYTASAAIHRDKVGGEDGGIAIKKGMSRSQVVDLATGE